MSTRRTVPHMQHDRMTANPQRTNFYFYRDDQWQSVSNADAQRGAAEVSMGLWSLGVRHGDRVAIMSNSRFEWDWADHGALSIGATVVSIYPTSTQETAVYILEHSGAKVAFLEDISQWNLLASELDGVADLEHVVLIDDADMPPSDSAETPRVNWLSLDDLRTQGRDLIHDQPILLDDARDSVRPGDLASLMYTSGTTGRPKGVALKHEMLFAVIETLGKKSSSKKVRSCVIYLPMSHILQRVNMYVGRYDGSVAYFAPSMTDLIMTCQEANPTSLTGVPRVYEKIHARIMASVEQAPPDYQRDFHAALDAGRQRIRLEQAGKSIPLDLQAQNTHFDQLVFRKLRQTIFGKNIRYLTCGAAPISSELLEFFFAIGVPILEGYGLTETCSPITFNSPKKPKIGTVGPALPGSQIKIAKDGEVLLKGPSVFQHYYSNPDATRESFTADGWFRSGDIGELDSDGYLTITDRKKFLIITAAGKNIAPAPIEQKLLQHPLVGQVVVHGDQRKHLTALLTLAPEGLTGWVKQNGTGGMDSAELINHPKLKAELEQHVATVNGGVAQYETIKQFRILPEEFSVENGYLTQSLKIKRKTIELDFVEVLDEMYSA